MKKKEKYAFIVDRDEFVRLSLKKILQKYGFEVEEIEDFSRLEDRKKEIDRGIILADIEADTLEQWIPSHKKWNDHFIYMSPLITDEMILRLKKMGIRRMIKKPVEIRQLKRVIREICPSEGEDECFPGKGQGKGSRSMQKGGESI